jgi:putative transposase
MSDDTFVRYGSRVYMYGHYVWITKYRVPSLTPQYERRVHRCIVANAQKLKCKIFALGGMPDHVHIVVKTPGNLSPATFAKRVKGPSAILMNHLRPEGSEPFHWQDGYGAFSIGQSEEERQAVIAYVKNQKAHHANNDLIEDWETSEEPLPDTDDFLNDDL